MSAMVYLLQVSACMGLFYGFYYLMLSRLTFFTINRWYLVATLILSFAIPLLTITVRPDSAPIIKQVVYVNQLQTFQTQGPLTYSPQQVIEPVTNWFDVLKMGYLLAVIILFTRLIVMLAAFFSNIKSKKRTKIGNVHILHGDKKLNNGSFLNYIFINDDELSPDEIQQIIEHEMLHVKLLHSVDRILVKVAQIFLWFNPFVYLYVRAIEENHEFEVDREIGLLNDKSKYADMLLHLSVARQGMLYNSFSMVPLKKRIAMLFTKPTNHMKKVIYLLVLPLVTLSCLAFARLKKDALVNAGTLQSDTTKKKSKSALSKIKAEKSKPILSPIKAEKTKPAVLAKPSIEIKKASLLAQPVAEPGVRIDEPLIERTRHVYADGSKKDKVTFHLSDGSASAYLGVDDKIGAFIDGVFYDEATLKVLPIEKVRTLTITHEGFDAKKIPNGPYAVPFAFKSKPAAVPVTPKMGMRIEQQQPFFSRTPVEDSEGKKDKITFRYDDITSTTIVNSDMKTGAFIDGEFYKETELNTLPVSKIAGLGMSHGMLDVRKIPAGYHTSWSFRTKNSKGEVEEEVVSTKGMSQEDIARLNRELLAKEVFKRSRYPQFYSRIKFNAVDGKDHDYVVCTIGKGIVSVPVMLNAKTGLLIDGVFYDEDAVKKLPDSTTKKLEIWREGFDAKKVPKDYIAAFTLRTKAEK